MRTRLFLSIVCACLFVCIGACSKDKGNYNYKAINKLTISDQGGVDIANQHFDVTIGKQILIQPKVVGTLDVVDTNKLNFYWLINGDTVSYDQNFKFKAEQSKLGTYRCKLIVVDQLTTLSYSSNFTIQVSSGVIRGSFLLTENQNHESTLVMRSLAKEDEYLYFRNFGDIVLGMHPLSLELSYIYTTQGNQYDQLMIATQEGDYPLFGLDINALFPTFKYDFKPKIAEGKFIPTYIWAPGYPYPLDDSQGILLTDGKCRFFQNGLIGDIIYGEDPLNYDFGENGVLLSKVSPGNFIAGFDRKNERIRMFGNKDSRSWIFSENFDNRFDPTMTKGHQYVAVRENYNGTTWQWQFITCKGSEFFLHRTEMDISKRPYKPKPSTIIASKVLPEMVGGVDFVFNGGYWYFAKGRSIFRCPESTLNIETYLILPEDASGNITAWSFDIDAVIGHKKIGIATYNQTASAQRKGSYYLFDIATKKFDQQHLYVIDKAVDVKVGI